MSLVWWREFWFSLFFLGLGGLLGWPHVFHDTVHIPHILEEWLQPITALSSTFEVTVDRTDPNAGDDDDDDHDIIFDPDGDLKPKPTPTTGTSASLNNGLSALG